MDKLKSEEDKLGSATPTVFAEDSGVVTAIDFKNVKAKSINMKIERMSQPGSMASGNVVEQVPQALVARGNTVVRADKFDNVELDGDIDLSVSVKPANACAGTVDETMSSYMDLG